MTTRWPTTRVVLWGTIVCAVVLALYAPCILWPMLLVDDFQILAASWTWNDALANLWAPNNEHSMPLGRLSTWLLVQSAGRPTNVPFVFALQGPLALLGGMLLLYRFVRRETNASFPALLAMALFGITAQYQGAINWFAATFAVLALDTILLGLLAAQSWRRDGHLAWLFLSGVCAFLAPGWFALGILGGPLIALYLFASVAASWRERLLMLTPCLGTLLSLAITLPLNGNRILTLPRVEEAQATAWSTFRPLVGFFWSLRAIVDDLLPGLLGVSGLSCPLAALPARLGLVAVLAGWWWMIAAHRRLLLLGAGFILGSYLLIFSGRAYLSYDDVHAWSRYHLFAQLGLALFICGGWPFRHCLASEVIARRPGLVDLGMLTFLAFLVVAHLPRYNQPSWDPRQGEDLRRIEKVDAVCREHHISAETARKVLRDFDIAGCYGRKWNGRVLSGLYFVRGSSQPTASEEEARRALSNVDP